MTEIETRLREVSTADLLAEILRRQKRAAEEHRLIQNTLPDQAAREEVIFSFDEILSAVATYYQLDPGVVLSGPRDAHIIRARHAAMYFCEDLTDRGPSDIARFFDNCHHATVLHALGKIKDLRECDQVLDAELRELKLSIVRFRLKR